jgi:phosphomannomutase
MVSKENPCYRWSRSVWFADVDSLGEITENDAYGYSHWWGVEPLVDVEAVKAAKFKVVVEWIHGIIIPKLLS